MSRHTVLLLVIAEHNIKVEDEKNEHFLRVMHKRAGSSQAPNGREVPSTKKPNVKT